MRLDERGHGLVKAGDVGEAAAEDDDVGVEDVDDDGEGAAEAVLVAAQGFLGGGVAGRGQVDDFLGLRGGSSTGMPVRRA